VALKSDAADMVDARGGEVKGDVSGERFESNIPFPSKICFGSDGSDFLNFHGPFSPGHQLCCSGMSACTHGTDGTSRVAAESTSCSNMATDPTAQLLTFRCDASAAQWQVFGELARQLGALASEWTRVEPPAASSASSASAAQSSTSTSSSSTSSSSSSSSSSAFWAAWHLWIADRGALPWAALNALPPLGARSRRLVNYFRGFTELTMKARMARNIIAHCAERRADAFAHMPVSFIVQPGEGAGHAERIRFAEYERQCSPTSTSGSDPACTSAESTNAMHRPKWIAKSTHGAKGG
jgi:hypothetical protein